MATEMPVPHRESASGPWPQTDHFDLTSVRLLAPGQLSFVFLLHFTCVLGHSIEIYILLYSYAVFVNFYIVRAKVSINLD